MSARAWGAFGKVCDAHSLYDPAEHCYDRARKLAPDDFRWPYFQALMMDFQGADIEQIVQLFRQAESIQPQYPPLQVRLGDALVRQGELVSAQDAYQAALTKDSRMGVAYRNLGQVLILTDDIDQAIQKLERAAELLPQDRSVYSALARAYNRRGQSDRAKRAAQTASSLTNVGQVPDPARNEVIMEGISATLCMSRAADLMRLGSYTQAIQDLTIAAEVRPDDPYLQNRLDNAFLESGQPERALHHWNRALALKDDFHVAHAKMGSLLFTAGRFAEALPHLRGAVERGASDAIVHTRLASALAQTGQLDRALVVFDNAAAQFSLSAAAHNDWGTALLQKRRTDDALIHYRQAIRIDPNFANAYFNLGVALQQLGRTSEAISHYRRAVQIDPAHAAVERLRQLQSSSRASGSGADPQQ